MLNDDLVMFSGLYKVRYFTLLLLPFLLSCSFNNESKNSSKPNIIIILADDLGYGDLGCYGSETIKTPHIDQLAIEGIRLTDFYVHPVCSPTRAALLTGSYAPRTGFADVQLWGSPFGLSSEEVTVAELLKKEGYITSCIGKWHLGEQDAFAPNQQGFDYFYGIRLVNGTQKFENFAVPLYRNDSLITIRPDHARMTRDFTEESLLFIEKNKEKPFFLYLAFTMPHVPIYPGEGFRGKSAAGLYGDAVEEIDWSVGKITGKLNELGLDENTLVIFISDNGPWQGHGDQAGTSGPLRGGKMTSWEGGVRVPCIVKWKNMIPASQIYKEVAGVIDIAPTIAFISGAEMPKDRISDGVNIFHQMTGENKNPPHKAYYYNVGTWLQAIRSGKWKLIFARPNKLPGIYGECAPWLTYRSDTLQTNLLIDLDADIGETTNLATEHPEIVRELTELANFARDDIGDYGRKGIGSRPIGSTYPELKDISKYPESPFAITMADSMMREMRTFQKKRFRKLISQDTALLNNQEKEELKFYIEQIKLK